MKVSYIATPEFHRNLWIKFSPFKLIAAPVFLALCAAILFKLLPAPFFGAPEKHLMNASLWLYFIVVVIWGNHEASNALRDEMQANTWDFQRMSSITPFQLAVGKLLGATSYVWYVGLLTLIPFAYGFSAAPMPSYGFEFAGAGGMVPVVLLLILSGVIGQSLAFLISFIDMTSFAARTGKKRVPRAVLPFSLSVVASWYVFNLAQDASPRLAEGASFFREHPRIEWFGTDYHTSSFIVCSLLVFLFWFVLGSYRIARSELLYRAWPVAWFAFVAFLLLWFRGFADPGEPRYYMQLMGLFILSLFLAYAVMLFEASDRRKYARFAESFLKGDYLRAFEDMHRWAVTVPFVLLTYAATLMNVPEKGLCLGFSAIGGFMVAILLFALRDGLVIHALIRGTARNLAFKALFYYLCAYVLLPLLHFSVSPKSLDVMDFSLWSWARRVVNCRWKEADVPEVIRSLAAYYPLPLPNFADAVLPVLVQAAAAGAWLFWSFNRARIRKTREG